MDEQRVAIESELHEPEDLRSALERTLGASVTLTVERSESPFRVDPTVLIALIQGGATALAAVISAIATIVAKQDKTRIVLVQAEDGTTVEVPARSDDASVRTALALLGDRRVVRITLREG